MDEKSNDVKIDTASSTESKQDVKPTFDQQATAMVDALVAGASKATDENAEDSSVVLNKNKTDASEQTDSVQDIESDDTTDQEEEKESTDSSEETTEEQTSADEDDNADSTETSKDDKETADSTKKTESSVPYDRFKEVNDKLVTAESEAQHYRGIVNYCQSANISPEQYKEGMEILRLINTDPTTAVTKLESLLGNLKAATGINLPADLQKELDEAKSEVTDGTMSDSRYKTIESRIKELAKLRADQANLQRRGQQSIEQQAEQQKAEVTRALSEWSHSKQKADPDFKPKAKDSDPDGKFEEFIVRNTYYWSTQPPKTIQQAIALADKALSDVNALAKRYGPKPPLRKTITSTGSVVNGRKSSNGTPKSMDDVAAMIGRKHGYNL